MEQIYLFLKGLMIGIGKIIPGVSGSLIAVVLHVYEEAIFAINHFVENPKKYFSFLFPLGFGVLLSAILFSNVILFLFQHFYYITMFFFLGLILGTVPSFQKEIQFRKNSHFLLFLVFFALPFFIPLFSFNFSPSFSLWFFGYLILLGFLDATTMIIPGISGTAIFLMLGSYDIVLSILSNPLGHLWEASLYVVGLCLGILMISRLVEFLMNRVKNEFHLAIDGLLWSSILYLFLMVSDSITLSSFFPFFLVLSFGFFLSYLFSK